MSVERTKQPKIMPLGTQVASTDQGIVTHAVIHGLSSSGGGTWYDVKVNPSGSLEINANQATAANLNATVVQGTATNLKSQAECYQGGSAVSSSNPLYVTTADSSPATANITIVDSSSSTASGANSQSIITGSPTAGSAASFSVSGNDAIRVQVTGTWTGTLQSEVSIDGGTTWYIVGVHQTGTAYTVATFTANFSGSLNISGCTNYRIRATAAITGTATVKIVSTQNISSIYVANGLNIQDAVTQSTKAVVKAASTPAAATDAAFVVSMAGANSATKIGDGTNNATIKAASTAAATADPALVVSMAGANSATKIGDGTNNATIKAASTAAAFTDPALTVDIRPGAIFPVAASAGDGSANPTNTSIRDFAHHFNGASWDRTRGNVEVTLLASGARTTTQTSADIVCYNHKTLIVVLDMTVVGTGSVTVTINGKDSASGKYRLLLSGTAITSNSTNTYKIGPNLAASANAIAQDYLPRIIQIVVTANNANSATYSVGYCLGL